MEPYKDVLLPSLSLLFSLGGGIVAWLVADAMAKTRSRIMEEQLKNHQKSKDGEISSLQVRMGSLEIKMARSEQDRAELHRMNDRLDASKASKEVVDGIRTDITSLRQDMDKRFDKLERLLEYKMKEEA